VRSAAIGVGYTDFMLGLGRMLVILGVGLIVLGGIVILLGRFGVPIGRLPGDITYRGKNTTVYFPWVSSILISVVLSIVLFLLGRLRR
jgi:hypothetical protein